MQTLLLPSDRKFGICYWIASLRMLYLTYVFNIKNFEMWLFRKRWELAQKFPTMTTFKRFIFAIEWNHFECYTPWPWPKFSMSNFLCGYFDKSRFQKCKHYYCHQIGSQVFAIEFFANCECCRSWHWPTFSRSIILKCEYVENGESERKMLKYDFYIGWHLQSNVAFAIGVLRDLDVHFKVILWLCICCKKMRMQRMSY